MNAVNRSRVIVMEGVDGSGKSTLAAELVKDFKLELVHTGGFLKDRQAFLDREKDKGLLNATAGRVYDRVPYISDLVYSFLEAREPIVQDYDVRRFLDQVNPIIIYCRLSSAAEMYDNISMEKKAHKSAEHMEKVKAAHPALLASYDKVIHDLGLHHRAMILRFNWKLDSYSSLKFALNSLVGS